MTATIVEDPEITALQQRAQELQERLAGLSTRLAYGEPAKPSAPLSVEAQVDQLERVVKWKEGGYHQPRVVTVPDGNPVGAEEEAEEIDLRREPERTHGVARKLMDALADWPVELQAAVVKALNAGAKAQEDAFKAKVEAADKAIPAATRDAFEATTLGDQDLAEARLAQIAELEPLARDFLMQWLPGVVVALKIAGRSMLDSECAFLRGPLLFGPAEEVTKTIEVVAAIAGDGGYGTPLGYGAYWPRDVVRGETEKGLIAHFACVALLGAMSKLADYLPEKGKLMLVPFDYTAAGTESQDTMVAITPKEDV